MSDEAPVENSIASMGGKAAAAKMTPEERKERARKAAESRWNADVPRATHQGTLMIGDKEISAAVLPGGKRIITQATFLRALGRSRSPKAGTGVLTTVDELPFFLQAEVLKPFIGEDLRASTKAAFFLEMEGKKNVGYDALALPGVAEVYLQMRDDFVTRNQLPPKPYRHIIVACDLLIRGLARVGIIALVDEATGFQYDRPRRDLEEHLKKYLTESLRRWVRTFPADYFRELCRLRGVTLRPDMRLPQYFGKLTNNLIYRRIAPNLLKGLKNKRVELDTPNAKLHSGLSLDHGVPELLLHLGSVTTVMKMNTDYDAFVKQLDKILPVFPEVPGLFDDPKDWQ
jgi:hypothetical protein